MTDPTAKQEIFRVLRAQAGDREAFDELLKAVQGALFRYISRLVAGGGDAALAEDVLQEVFLIIYRKLRWLENPELFRPWAYRIASRETFRRLKQEKRWSEQIRDESVLQAMALEEEEMAYAAELVNEIPALLAEVSPAARAVLALHYLEEMPLSRVAEILEISLGTAKSRLAYGLRSLRVKLKERSD